MSSASCHLGRWCLVSGILQACLRAPASGLSQLAGRNRRQASGQEAVSVAAWTLTPIWQLPTLPRAPEYWRANGRGGAVFGAL